MRTHLQDPKLTKNIHFTLWKRGHLSNEDTSQVNQKHTLHPLKRGHLSNLMRTLSLVSSGVYPFQRDWPLQESCFLKKNLWPYIHVCTYLETTQRTKSECAVIWWSGVGLLWQWQWGDLRWPHPIGQTLSNQRHRRAPPHESFPPNSTFMSRHTHTYTITLQLYRVSPMPVWSGAALIYVLAWCVALKILRNFSDKKFEVQS